ncbi:MAG: methionine biosynthesis protein MetW [Magnetococcales bacterium]|nr:methionine biosynthesis protein MetW [Magnetococcales bacterium]
MHRLRIDQAVIADLVTEGARVLDLGCGDGLLLEHLIRHQNARGFGVEISHEGVHNCIARGLPVYQGDIDQGLSDHHDDSFDYVILSHTLHAIHRPEYVLKEVLRVGKKGIVSFPNFGYWRVRFGLLFSGRMPRTRLLPHRWYDTPYIHMCTILDFQDLCAALNIRILRRIPLAVGGQLPRATFQKGFTKWLLPPVTANLLAPVVVFLLEKNQA